MSTTPTASNIPETLSASIAINEAPSIFPAAEAISVVSITSIIVAVSIAPIIPAICSPPRLNTSTTPIASTMPAAFSAGISINASTVISEATEVRASTPNSPIAPGSTADIIPAKLSASIPATALSVPIVVNISKAVSPGKSAI